MEGVRRKGFRDVESKPGPFKHRRVDWIRTKAPFETEYASGWRTEAVGKEGAFDDDYRM